MGALDKLETVGVLGIIIGGAYLIWSRWGDITSNMCKLPGAQFFFGTEMCPVGPGGGGGIACDLTMNTCWNQGFRDVDTVNCQCIDPIVTPPPPQTCTLTSDACKEFWADGYVDQINCTCKGTVPRGDEPQTCTGGKVWDFILKACVTPTPGKKTCPDGSWVYDYQSCPTVPKEDPFEDPSAMCGVWPCKQASDNFDRFLNGDNTAIVCDDGNVIPWLNRFRPEILSDVIAQCTRNQTDKLDVVTCVCDPVLGTTVTYHPGIETCATACQDRIDHGFTDLTCYQKRDDCGANHPGIGSAIGLTHEACLAQGYTYFDGQGACWNQARQDYMDCMKPCPNW